MTSADEMEMMCMARRGGIQEGPSYGAMYTEGKGPGLVMTFALMSVHVSVNMYST